MAQSLAAHLPQFKMNVKKILEDGAREAMRTAYVGGGDADPAIQSYIKKQIYDAADKWAKKFTDEISEKLCDEINNHIKEMWIIVSGHVIPSTSVLASPMGPVTGTLNLLQTDFTIS